MTLFVLNFAGSTAIALALVVPIGRASRYGRQILSGVAALGIGVAAGGAYLVGSVPSPERFPARARRAPAA